MYWHRFYGKVFKLEIILDLSCMLTFFFTSFLLSLSKLFGSAIFYPCLLRLYYGLFFHSFVPLTLIHSFDI